MKLFLEYYAGHINHDFHLFGADDIEFLRQLPDRFWKYAIIERYCVDLPRALEGRDIKRSESLDGFRTTQNYNEYIESIADSIKNQLTYQGRNDTEVKRIDKLTKDTAKNMVDSSLAEFQGGENDWMTVDYQRTEYFGHNIQNNYIKELVKRMEDKPGGSVRGYDLSNIRDYDEESGEWKTDGFQCPKKEIIGKNFIAWMGYASQGLLHNPAEFYTAGLPEAGDDEQARREKEEAATAAREQHRIAPRKHYNPNIRAGGESTNEYLDDLIYRKTLRTKYRRLLGRLSEKMDKPDEEGRVQAIEYTIPDTDPDLITLQDQFRKKIPAKYKKLRKTNPNFIDYSSEYCYEAANRGHFPEQLAQVMPTGEAHTYNADQLRDMIKNIVGTNIPFTKNLIDGLVDIELIEQGVVKFHPERRPEKLNILHRENPRLRTATEFENILHPSFGDVTQTVPTGEGEDAPSELRSGKILFHIDSIRERLQKKLDKALALGQNEKAEKLRNALNELNSKFVTTHGVGHHYDVLDPRKPRGKLFLQFGHESEVPKYDDEDEESDQIYDMRLKNLAGGIKPNQNMPGAKGPKTSTNIVNCMRNLMPFFNQNDSDLKDFVSSHASKNFMGDFNIIFKAFMDGYGRPLSGRQERDTYNLYIKLIKDQLMRNIGLFDFRDRNDQPIENKEKTESEIIKIINSTLKNLLEKEVGDAGTMRLRIGELSSVQKVKSILTAMLKKINGR